MVLINDNSSTGDQTPDVSEQTDQPAEGESDFLSMVRENNVRREQRTDENNGEPPRQTEQTDDTPEDGEDDPKDAPDLKLDDVDVEDSDDQIDVDPLVEKEPKKRKTKEDNIKGLRTALKTERDEKAALKEQLEAANQKLEQTGDVEKLQEELQSATERIQELEKYEKLLGVKQTKAYKEKYIDGVDQLLGEVSAIAKDYDVPTDVLKKAVGTKNRKALNQLLSQHFDTLGANDVRPIILKIQDLLIEKKQVEQDPVKAEADILKATEDREKEAQATARKELQSTVQEGWADIQTLYSTKDSGVEILQEISGNEEHNKQRREVISKAAKDFGAVMGKLVKNGLRKMDPDVSKTFAARFQLAEVAKYLISENQELASKAADLEKKLRQRTGYTRPLSNGNAGRGGSDPAPKEITGKDIAHAVFERATERLTEQ